jgi:hypothetical protein
MYATVLLHTGAIITQPSTTKFATRQGCVIATYHLGTALTPHTGPFHHRRDTKIHHIYHRHESHDWLGMHDTVDKCTNLIHHNVLEQLLALI